MVKEIIWSTTAEKEMNDILNFWLIHNQSPTYSIKLFGLINEAIEGLPYYPLIGRKTDFGNSRLIIVDSYLVFYEVHATQIVILSVCDGRQDPENIAGRFE